MMPVINYIEQYYQAILDGREVVGRWIRIWYKMVLDGVASGTWFYDGKKARRVIRFVETMCHHSKGRRDYIKLELWQKAFLSVRYKGRCQSYPAASPAKTVSPPPDVKASVQANQP